MTSEATGGSIGGHKLSNSEKEAPFKKAYEIKDSEQSI